MAEFNFTVAKDYSYEDFKKTVVKGPVELRQVVEGEAYLACLMGLSKDRWDISLISRHLTLLVLAGLVAKIPSEMEVALLHKEHLETLGSSRNIKEHLDTSGNI